MGTMRTFEDYSKARRALSFEDMQRIHLEMLDSVGKDPDAEELFCELLETAFQYANIRACWSIMSLEARGEMDRSRTSKHDSLIVKFNQLARYLERKGGDVSWRKELGYEEDDHNNRKRIGDMACYLAFVGGVNSR